MSRSSSFHALVLLALAVLVASPVLAAKEKTRDLVVQSPDFAAHAVRSIAMLPIATFDRNTTAERLVGTLWAQKLAGTGYRWISPGTTREMIASALGDSVVKAVQQQVLKNARVDSTAAPLLCARLRTNAVMSVRVDQWEQQPVLWNQSGRSMTSIQLKAALVDSSGALLWSISGAETAEGQYHDPSANPISVSSSNLENQPVTGEGAPPQFEEVLNRLLVRWAPLFPPVPAAAKP